MDRAQADEAVKVTEAKAKEALDAWTRAAERAADERTGADQRALGTRDESAASQELTWACQRSRAAYREAETAAALARDRAITLRRIEEARARGDEREAEAWAAFLAPTAKKEA